MNQSEERGRSAPTQSCSCMQDPLGALPPEVVPRAAKKSSLRRVACPGCGRVYLTNRKTDLCMDCERKGVQLPEPPVDAEE
jgi:hypothetical protein